MAADDLIPNDIDRLVMVYIFQPIILKELEAVRRDYNAYPMRKNRLSKLPSGSPEENYVLLINRSDAVSPIEARFFIGVQIFKFLQKANTPFSRFEDHAKTSLTARKQYHTEQREAVYGSDGENNEKGYPNIESN